MTLPTFLGIGVPRAGTTWLHTLLSGHPDVYLPVKRKEVRFFDRHFGHGPSWYEAFFPPSEEASRYRAIGEISPQYLYCDACPDRIAALLPDVRLLVMLRHPVDRAYSHYGFVRQRKNYGASFEEFLSTRPRALEMGHYSRHLERFAERFGRDRILPLLFEEAVSDRSPVRRELAGFLGIDEARFPAAVERVNPSTVPRFGSLSSAVVHAGRRLRRSGLEPLVDLAGRLGLRRLITSGRRAPRLDPALRSRLSEGFEGEFEELERDWGLDLGAWRTGAGRPAAGAVRETGGDA